MLEEEWKKITEETLPGKNLKWALLALGYSILASVAQYIAIDGFGPGANGLMIKGLIAVYFILTIVSGVYAFMACRNSLKSLQTNKSPKNYIALLLGGLLLIGIVTQIIGHF
jgi:hypothetical protein